MTWPSIPSWEQTELQQMASAGDLSGVPALALGDIDDAESSGSGGGINSEGYGGFFGLGANTKYPGGSTSTAMLDGTTQDAFAQQASIAASEYSSLLKQYGGNFQTAEEAYQDGTPSGPTEGSQIMAEYPPTGTTGGGSASTGQLTWSLTPFQDAGQAGSDVGGAIGSAIGGAASSWVQPLTSFLAKALLVAGGVAIVVVGLYKTASPETKQASIDLSKLAPQGAPSTGGGGAGSSGGLAAEAPEMAAAV